MAPWRRASYAEVVSQKPSDQSDDTPTADRQTSNTEGPVIEEVSEEVEGLRHELASARQSKSRLLKLPAADWSNALIKRDEMAITSIGNRITDLSTDPQRRAKYSASLTRRRGDDEAYAKKAIAIDAELDA